jgi:hypothetical protein
VVRFAVPGTDLHVADRCPRAGAPKTLTNALIPGTTSERNIEAEPLLIATNQCGRGGVCRSGGLREGQSGFAQFFNELSEGFVIQFIGPMANGDAQRLRSNG